MTYNFKVTKTFLILIRLSLVLAATSIVFAVIFTYGKFGKINNEFLFLTCFVMLAFLFFFLTQKIIIVDITARTFDKNKIEFVQKYFLRTTKRTILASEIRNYSYENGMGYKIFDLKRKKGFNLKFLIVPDIENLESFNNFFQDLKGMIEKQNEENNLDYIHKSSTIYRTKLGLIYGAVLLLILIAIPIAYLIFKTSFNIGFLLILYPAAIAFLVRLYLERKDTF